MFLFVDMSVSGSSTLHLLLLSVSVAIDLLLCLPVFTSVSFYTILVSISALLLSASQSLVDLPPWSGTLISRQLIPS